MSTLAEIKISITQLDARDRALPAAYFAAIRRGTPPADAEAQHLLRGRTREQLDAELQKLTRRLALEVR